MKIQYKYVLLIIWLIVIFLFSNEGTELSSGRSSAIVEVLTTSFAANLPQDILTFLTRKAAHIIAYFILGLLLYSVVKEYEPRARRIILWSVLFALLYAVSDEVHQLFVPGRSPEVRDVIIDTVASGVGAVVYYLVRKIRCAGIKSKNSI